MFTNDTNTKVLHEKRLKAIADARTILETAKRDGNRALSANEASKFDAFMVEADSIKAQVDRESKLFETETTTRESYIDLRAVADSANGHGRRREARDGRFFGVELRGLVGNTGSGSAVSGDEYADSFKDALVAESVGLASDLPS